MFQTVSSAELASMPPLYPDGPRTFVWGYVIHWHESTWFHVEVAGESEGQVIFATESEQWLPLTRSSGSQGLRVRAVSLVSPPWVNGSDGWKLERLNEIWRGREPLNSDSEAEIYVVTGGARYVVSRYETPEARLGRLECVYKAKA